MVLSEGQPAAATVDGKIARLVLSHQHAAPGGRGGAGQHKRHWTRDTSNGLQQRKAPAHPSRRQRRSWQ